MNDMILFNTLCTYVLKYVVVCRYYFNLSICLKKHKLRKGAIPLKLCEPETSEPAVDPMDIGVNSN